MQTDDLFEQLACPEVPPPPANFERRVHLRLNKYLAALHVVEFALRAVPYALGHFAKAVVGLARYTFTGRHSVDRSPRSIEDGRSG